MLRKLNYDAAREGQTKKTHNKVEFASVKSDRPEIGRLDDGRLDGGRLDGGRVGGNERSKVKQA